MNLFPCEPTRNLLPFDGIVNYYGPILRPCDAEDYLEALLTTVRWKSDEAIVCGKHIVTARKVACYGDSIYSYTYSGTTKIALPWTRELLALKTLVEDKAQCSFNSCLCNLYHDGSEGMGWHRDVEGQKFNKIFSDAKLLEERVAMIAGTSSCIIGGIS